jgi:hypothetical protein
MNAGWDGPVVTGSGAAAVIVAAYLATNAEAILLSESADATERLVDRTVDVFRKWAT